MSKWNKQNEIKHDTLEALDSATIIEPGKSGSDPSVVQTFDELKGKADAVTVGEIGEPLKKRRKKRSDSGMARDGEDLEIGGLTDLQVSATFKGLHQMLALYTDCNIWFLTDDECNCFVPSTTIALNKVFPGLATSKWGALTLAGLSYSFVMFAKTLVYLDYKRKQKAERARAASDTPAPMA